MKMRVATGQLINPCNPAPEDIRVWDFAWALHHINRYLGHTPVPWSVLSHTGLCFQLAMMDTKGEINPLDRIGILIHDAPEAYLGDVPRPIKYLDQCNFFREAEEVVMAAILARLGIEHGAIDWELVKRYDDQALHVEMHTLTPDLRGNPFMPAAVYEAGYPKMGNAKPWDYVQLLRDLLINLADSNGGKPADINGLFYLPDALAPYAKPEDLQPKVSTTVYEPGNPMSDQGVLNMRV